MSASGPAASTPRAGFRGVEPLRLRDLDGRLLLRRIGRVPAPARNCRTGTLDLASPRVVEGPARAEGGRMAFHKAISMLRTSSAQ